MFALYRGPKFGYTMSQKDIDVLARSLWGEASTEEGKIAVAWCHMMRFHLIKYRWQDKDGFKWKFYQYMQAHSQPINPIWRRDGSRCVPGGNPGPGVGDCQEYLLARRDKYQLTPYEKIPAINRRIAEDFAAGKIRNPFSEPVYDFAACSRTRGIDVAGNCFNRYEDLSAAKKTSVIPGTVTVGAAAHSKALTAGGIVVGSVLLIYGLFKLLSE